MAPSLSLDGRFLYFGSDQDGPWQIWRAPFGGGDPIRITRQGGIRALEVEPEVLYISRPDRPGFWRVPATGGDEVLVFTPEEPMHWADWTAVAGRIYFRSMQANPVVPSLIFVYDVARAQLEAVAENVPGRATPGLGMTVDRGDGVLLYASIDSSDGDIMLVEGFR